MALLKSIIECALCADFFVYIVFFSFHSEKVTRTMQARLLNFFLKQQIFFVRIFFLLFFSFFIFPVFYSLMIMEASCFRLQPEQVSHVSSLFRMLTNTHAVHSVSFWLVFTPMSRMLIRFSLLLWYFEKMKKKKNNNFI